MSALDTIAHDCLPPSHEAYIDSSIVDELVDEVAAMGLLDDMTVTGQRERDLDVLRDRVRRRSLAPDIEPAQRIEVCRLLLRIHAAQIAQSDGHGLRLAGGAVAVHHVVSDLDGVHPDRLADLIPERVCVRFGLGRSMMSYVGAGIWSPRRLHVQSASAPENIAFGDYVRNARIPLLRAPLETEIARRRRPAICSRAAEDTRTFKEIVAVAETTAYIAAPIVVRNRVFAFLHADRPVAKDTVDDSDLMAIGALSVCLSSVFERALLAEQLRIELERTDAILGGAAGELDEARAAAGRSLGTPPASSLSQRPPDVSRWSQRQFAEAPDVLTARERDVLHHMGTGATNAQIGSALSISEQTVKSHVVRIFSKIGVHTRAAAVAWNMCRDRGTHARTPSTWS